MEFSHLQEDDGKIIMLNKIQTQKSMFSFKCRVHIYVCVSRYVYVYVCVHRERRRNERREEGV